MTEGSKEVLKFLQKHPDKEYTKREIAENIDCQMPVVTGSITNLIRKGFVSERVQTAKPIYPGEKEQRVKFVQITKEGLVFDPDEAERQAAQEKLEARALRREARRLEREELARKNAVL